MAWREVADLPVLFLGTLGYGRAVSLGILWRCWWLYSVLEHEMESKRLITISELHLRDFIPRRGSRD